MSWQEELSRREVRYLCFRLRTEAEGGNAAPELPEGFLEYFEGHSLWNQFEQGFLGWVKFADSWDVDLEDPTLPVVRRFSIHQEWDATLRVAVPELPTQVDPNG